MKIINASYEFITPIDGNVILVSSCETNVVSVKNDGTVAYKILGNSSNKYNISLSKVSITFLYPLQDPTLQSNLFFITS